MPPTIGKPAPAFSLPSHDGTMVALFGMRGWPVVLYFYPRDDTPTCTKESCAFRDDFSRFQDLNAVVLGVSPDSVESHAKFRRKYQLPFTLLSDHDHAVAERYGVWGPKKVFGVPVTGILRTTFVIDRHGVLRNVFDVKRVAGHSEEVQEAIAALA